MACRVVGSSETDWTQQAGGTVGALTLRALPLPAPHTTARLATFADVDSLLRSVNCPAPEQCMLSLTLAEDATGRILAENHLLLTPPTQFVRRLPDPGLAIERVDAAHSGEAFNVTITCAHPPAALVWIESPFPGVWNDNAVLLLEGTLN